MVKASLSLAEHWIDDDRSTTPGLYLFFFQTAWGTRVFCGTGYGMTFPSSIPEKFVRFWSVRKMGLVDDEKCWVMTKNGVRLNRK